MHQRCSAINTHKKKVNKDSLKFGKEHDASDLPISLIIHAACSLLFFVVVYADALNVVFSPPFVLFFFVLDIFVLLRTSTLYLRLIPKRHLFLPPHHTYTQHSKKKRSCQAVIVYTCIVAFFKSLSCASCLLRALAKHIAARWHRSTWHSC